VRVPDPPIPAGTHETSGSSPSGAYIVSCRHIIRPYTAADAAGVRIVMDAIYGAKAVQQPVFDWWSFGCPEAVSGFMVADAAGQVVGIQPMEVLPFANGDSIRKGGLLTGVAVHPDYRRQGIFSALVRGCEQEAWRLGADFVTTMPNERSRPGFLKMGYTDLGRRCFLTHPLNARALGRAALPFPVLGSFAGVVAAAAQAVVKPLPRRGAIQVREVRGVDPAIEEVERLHANHFPGLRLRRSVAWWHWRYLESPEKQYRLFEARTPGGKLAGFAVSFAEIRDGLRIAYLMDLSVRGIEMLSDLLLAVFEAARQDAVLAVCAVASAPGMIRALRRAGFWAVPAWAPVKRFYTVARFNPSLDTRFQADWRRIGGWYQMLGDWDNL